MKFLPEKNYFYQSTTQSTKNFRHNIIKIELIAILNASMDCDKKQVS